LREDDLRSSDNIEDRRGDANSGGGGFQIGGGKLGIGGVVAVLLISWALGINPQTLLSGAQMLTTDQSQPATPAQRGTPNDAAGTFVARVLGETEDVWTDLLPQQAKISYQKPILVLFSGATRSGCGTAQAAMGPFYCPLDHKVYLDTAFFQDMQSRLGGGGDFAYAYVIAHEVGHHVQNLIGLLPRVQRQEEESDEATANALSVKVELMADCLAGVWANKMNQRHANIDDTDIRQAVATASAIGDDRLEKEAQGYAVPDSFTHGTSAQRVHWLTAGLQGGTLQSCNTFQAQ
jgi:predicted metalloprotease